VLVSEGRVVLANELAESLLGVDPRDVGRPFQDVELSYRPVELRSSIEDARARRQPLRIRDVAWDRPNRDPLVVDIQVVPVEVGGHFLGVALFFTDLTRYQHLRRELEHANGMVATAYEELQSTNEELETTNEELQSTVEELETTNEELQSTNEELETMNEELQSMNDEMQAGNLSLRTQSGEIEQLNDLLQGVLAGQRGTVAVVDTDVRVVLWNARSEEMWGARSDEVLGQHLFNLDIGLPLEQVRPMIRELLSDDSGLRREGEPVDLDAHDRRGRPLRVRVSGSTLLDRRQRVSGVILVSDELPGRADGGAPAGG
jgi:two-component system CheB/CheR fusion protein